MKTRNLRRDPRASLCVFTDGFFGDWVQVEGTAEIISLPAAMDLLVDYYRAVAGEHPDWDDYRAAMRRDRRVIIRDRDYPGRAGHQRLTFTGHKRRQVTLTPTGDTNVARAASADVARAASADVASAASADVASGPSRPCVPGLGSVFAACRRSRS